MKNALLSSSNFEEKKNIKAGTYTIVICLLLLLVFFLKTWTIPTLPQPLTEDGIEVNLGNSDNGFGTDQAKNENESSAAEAQQKYTPPNIAENAAIKDVETDDNTNEDAPIIKKAVTEKAVKISAKDVTDKKPVHHVAKPIINPEPSKPKPKAVFNGTKGNGTGGNQANSYARGGNEGIAGGRGDQGHPGGNPDSRNYVGTGGNGNSGVSISKGLQGRKITKLPSFEDNFNENAKVAIEITVNETGKVSSANYQPRGSTTANNGMKAIAIQKALQLKFNPGEEESTGIIIFNFKLKN